MTELFNTVSNSDYDDENPRIGNSIMDSGDVVLLEEGIYTCLFPWSASPHNGASGHNCVGTYMLHLLDLHGEIKCKEDDMKSCVLNSEARNGGMNVQGTGGGTLTIRAIWFEGGGLRAVNAGSNTVADGAQVEIQLCAFVNCAVNHYTVETAPIYSERHSHANIMGTVFNNNDYGGGDIQTALSGTYDVLDTCPSPYTSITPIKGTTPASYKCLCDNGYSGTIPNCSPNACQATTTSTDDGSDGNFYCVNGGDVGGTTGSCTCTSCNEGFGGAGCQGTVRSVYDMTTLRNTVSASMDHHDVVMLQEGVYKCENSGDNCVDSDNMLRTDIVGEIRCENDLAALCVLDGESNRRGLSITYHYENPAGKFTVGAILFKDGLADKGGGLYVYEGAIVDIELCAFVNCKATSSDYGGGAIFVNQGGTINLMGVTFDGNHADSGKGNDIQNGPDDPSDQTSITSTITVLTTCPSPYSSITPIQGKTSIILMMTLLRTAIPPHLIATISGSGLDTYAAVDGSRFSYTCVCGLGYSGTLPNCSPNACQATTTSTDDGSDGNFYCVNGGNIGGTTGSCFCTCNDDWVGESCESTPSPTASPTQSPTRSPTQSPTQTPTTSPTLALPSSTQTPTTSPALAPTGPTTSAVCPAGDTMDNLKCPLAHRDELDLCSYGLYCCKNWYGETASCSEGYEVEVIETGTLFGVWWQSSPPMP